MIIRPLTLTINNDKATLNEKVTLFLGDGGICLEIQLKSVKFGFNGQEMLHNEDLGFADHCKAYVKRPDGYVFTIPTVLIEDNKVHVYVEKTWTDEEVCDLGTHTIQLVLFSSDNSRITLPPFTITVAEPIYDFTPNADFLTEDYMPIVIEDGTGIRISQLPSTATAKGFVPIVQDNMTKKVEINLSQYASVNYIDNEVNRLKEQVYTSTDMDNKLANKADANHTHTSVNGITIVVVTEEEYYRISNKDANTLYVIKEA